MILYINTIKKNNFIEVAIKDEKKVIAKLEEEAKYSQSEKLLSLIDFLLSENEIKKTLIKGIEVENIGEGFTSLRIGVVTANALGFAWGVPVVANRKPARPAGGSQIANRKHMFDVVEPIYGREPNIT